MLELGYKKKANSQHSSNLGADYVSRSDIKRWVPVPIKASRILCPSSASSPAPLCPRTPDTDVVERWGGGDLKGPGAPVQRRAIIHRAGPGGRCRHHATASEQPMCPTTPAKANGGLPQPPASRPQLPLPSHSLGPWTSTLGDNGPSTHLLPLALSHTRHGLLLPCLVHQHALFSKLPPLSEDYQKQNKKKGNKGKTFPNRKINLHHTAFLRLSPQKTRLQSLHNLFAHIFSRLFPPSTLTWFFCLIPNLIFLQPFEWYKYSMSRKQWRNLQ